MLHDAGAARALHVGATAGSQLSFRLDDQTLAVDAVRDGDDIHVFSNGRHRVLTVLDAISHAGEGESEGRLAAPMSGKVIAVQVKNGAQVTKGTPLLVMEAMKMEHTIVAPADGTVDEVLYGVGDQVAEGAALVRFSGVEQ